MGIKGINGEHKNVFGMEITEKFDEESLKSFFLSWRKQLFDRIKNSDFLLTLVKCRVQI